MEHWNSRRPLCRRWTTWQPKGAPSEAADLLTTTMFSSRCLSYLRHSCSLIIPARATFLWWLKFTIISLRYSLYTISVKMTEDETDAGLS